MQHRILKFSFLLSFILLSGCNLLEKENKKGESISNYDNNKTEDNNKNVEDSKKNEETINYQITNSEFSSYRQKALKEGFSWEFNVSECNKVGEVDDALRYGKIAVDVPTKKLHFLLYQADLDLNTNEIKNIYPGEVYCDYLNDINIGRSNEEGQYLPDTFLMSHGPYYYSFELLVFNEDSDWSSILFKDEDWGAPTPFKLPFEAYIFDEINQEYSAYAEENSDGEYEILPRPKTISPEKNFNLLTFKTINGELLELSQEYNCSFNNGIRHAKFEYKNIKIGRQTIDFPSKYIEVSND